MEEEWKGEVGWVDRELAFNRSFHRSLLGIAFDEKEKGKRREEGEIELTASYYVGAELIVTLTRRRILLEVKRVCQCERKGEGGPPVFFIFLGFVLGE